MTGTGLRKGMPRSPATKGNRALVWASATLLAALTFSEHVGSAWRNFIQVGSSFWKPSSAGSSVGWGAAGEAASRAQSTAQVHSLLATSAVKGGRVASARGRSTARASPPSVITSGQETRAGIAGTGEERKLRSAISSIVRDQEDLRLSSPWLSFKNVAALTSGLGVAGAATAISSSPIWATAALPVLSCVLFVYASVAESSAHRSRGTARYNAGTAENFAARQESTLAEADKRKVGLPIGVGLTAICAAICLALKFYTEEKGYVGFDDVLVPIFAAAAVAGAIYTSDVVIRMRKALFAKPVPTGDEEPLNEFQASFLPEVLQEPDEQERAAAAFTAISICLAPLPVLFALQFSSPAAVIISACAAAYAGFTGLIAEKEFADAERRIAYQSKQAKLAELFYAQTTAEAANMPMRSAYSGLQMAAAALAVEFSTGLAGFFAWPALLSVGRSLLGAKLVRVEADATHLEAKVAQTGERIKRDPDSLASSFRELARFQSELLRGDSFDDSLRQQLNKLQIGEKLDFHSLPSDRRRRVHLLAAELGMASQSVGQSGQRVVRVVNRGGAAVVEDEQEEIIDIVKGAASAAKDQAIQVFNKGIPPQTTPLMIGASLAAATGGAAPFVTQEFQADLLVPIATGSVAMLTVWQERVGKEAVAIAKRDTADLSVKLSSAESTLGVALVMLRALPTYVGVTVANMTAVAMLGKKIPWLVVPLFGVSFGCMVLAMQRRRKIRKLVYRAITEIDGNVPPPGVVGRSNWWVLPALAALAVPTSLHLRVAAACAVFAGQIALIMSNSMAQLAAGDYYAARCARVFSRADTWAQEASMAARALPLTSAAAVVNTLLATTLAVVDTPLGAIFPLATLGIYAGALQNGEEAKESARIVKVECEDVQEIGNEAPPRLQRPNKQSPVRVDGKSSGIPSSTAGSSRARWADGLLDKALPRLRLKAQWPEFRDLFVELEPKLSERQMRRLWHAFREKGGARGGNREALRQVLLDMQESRFPSFSFRSINLKTLPRDIVRGAFRFLKKYDESGPEVIYGPTAAESAVKSIEGDLEELCVSVRSSEQNWQRTGSLVAVLPAMALLGPLFLSEAAVEVILPLVGGALVMFTTYAESNSRRSVAASKVWCAELNQVAATCEEQMQVAMLYKSRVFALTGVSAMVAILTFIVEHHWAHWLAPVQLAVQVGLCTFQGFLSTLVVPPMFKVWQSWQRVKQMADSSDPTVPKEERIKPPTFFKGFGLNRGGPKRLRRILKIGAVLPSLIFAFFPGHHHFAKRAVASTAGGALVIAAALFVAEKWCSSAEKKQAMRLRTHALADAFANEAEQQGAVLPLATAATLAAAGLVAFLTELNPLAAGVVTVFQAVSWVVASRKALATKFEAAAALEVTPRTFSESKPKDGEFTGEETSRQMKRLLLKGTD